MGSYRNCQQRQGEGGAGRESWRTLGGTMEVITMCEELAESEFALPRGVWGYWVGGIESNWGLRSSRWRWRSWNVCV